MEAGPGCLAGLRVVEVATMVFAPSASAVLADFGAEVIKIEPPGTGDLNRHYHRLPGMPVSDVPYTFEVDNRNKKSLAIDLKSGAGAEAGRRLIATADVFVTNYRPTALARLGLTYEELGALNPRLIYALGTAYGEHGPERDKPGYDSICYWSRSAIESQVFPLDGWLGPFPFGSGDHPSGMTLCGAILLGLYQREKTGHGCKVATSLLATGAWANATMLQAQLCGAELQPRRPRDRSYNFTHIHYRTRDGRLLKLCILNVKKDWAPFCRAIGREALIDDPRFARLEERREHMEELIRLVDEAFLERDRDEWVATLERYDIPFAILPTYEEAANDPQMLANQIVVPLEHPRATGGAIRTVNSPIEVEGFPKRPPTAAPELGRDTCAVLEALGYSAEEIRHLLATGTAEQGGGGGADGRPGDTG
jgi:crotonobetainyl-CoA:carnitine CoA-transferase CaiB-like acyl-CoA transferase